MSIPQTDGSGRCISAHPYPKATKDGKFEDVNIGGKWITRCRKTKRQVKIVGNKVTYYRRGTGTETW